MQNRNNITDNTDSDKLRTIEALVSDIIMWTLFLPIKLAFATMKAEKYKIPLIFLTVFAAYAYILSFMQIYNYANNAVEFKRDVISTMIFDRVEPMNSESLSAPAQNIPDVFSYTLVDSNVAIYHPDALSPDWSKEYEEAEDKLSELKYDSTVFVTANGTKFHLEDCRHLNDSAKGIIYQNALNNGYEPCKVCFKS